MTETFHFWQEGLQFISYVFVIVMAPCIAVAVLGTKLINHIGQYPSKSGKLQISICIQLLVVEIISFSMLAMFFHVFSD